MEAMSSHHICHQTALKFGTLSSEDVVDLMLYAISHYPVREVLKLSFKKKSVANYPC